MFSFLKDIEFEIMKSYWLMNPRITPKLLFVAIVRKYQVSKKEYYHCFEEYTSVINIHNFIAKNIFILLKTAIRNKFIMVIDVITCWKVMNNKILGKQMCLYMFMFYEHILASYNFNYQYMWQQNKKRKIKGKNIFNWLFLNYYSSCYSFLWENQAKLGCCI